MLKINIKPADGKNAHRIYSNTRCLLATSLRRQLPKSKILVMGFSCLIDGVHYQLHKKIRNFIHTSYGLDRSKYGDVGHGEKAIVEKTQKFTLRQTVKTSKTWSDLTIPESLI